MHTQTKSKLESRKQINSICYKLSFPKYPFAVGICKDKSGHVFIMAIFLPLSEIQIRWYTCFNSPEFHVGSSYISCLMKHVSAKSNITSSNMNKHSAPPMFAPRILPLEREMWINNCANRNHIPTIVLPAFMNRWSSFKEQVGLAVQRSGSHGITRGH